MNSIVWFRQDLRLCDNPALVHAASLGPIIPVFILEENSPGTHSFSGTAQAWWLHHSLQALSSDLPELRLFRGRPEEILSELAKKTGANAVFWNRRYEPVAIERDKKTKTLLCDHGIEVQSFAASLLAEPWTIKNGSGLPFKVFTPYWRSVRGRRFQPPLPRPDNLRIYNFPHDTRSSAPTPSRLEDWQLCPRNPDWAENWLDHWTPGEAGAFARLDHFINAGLRGYAALRDRPDRPNTSRLSAHLHFGEISPMQIAHVTAFASQTDPLLEEDAAKFMSEIGWREFAHHLHFHFPDLDKKNWKTTFDRYPWNKDDEALNAWKKGLTGYPIVDAGMRELWQTGFMHNRVRMVAASFLIKHLRIDWREGARWFLETLLDADLANNSAGWQWVAGSGADASPYFRIFNPTTQARKFDPEGTYIRKWCPELSDLDGASIHAPFEVPLDALARAGVVLGRTYPVPIVDHREARKSALDGYALVKDPAAGG
ncbi:MAG: deoxyribodipyrimidine photo-lyase [Stappiaceae bacterium]